VYAIELDATHPRSPERRRLMCPACLTSLIVAASATGSAGGLVAVAVKKLSERRKASLQTSQKEKTK